MRTMRKGYVPLTCWVCTGKNTRGKHHLCRRHFGQAEEYAAKFNISRDEAVRQMREEVLEEHRQFAEDEAYYQRTGKDNDPGKNYPEEGEHY